MNLKKIVCWLSFGHEWGKGTITNQGREHRKGEKIIIHQGCYYCNTQRDIEVRK